ncbi:hypothetical protein [Neisseria iguanae]|uniref:hypothetical protein n=1 Tax=Neisseria iguanae TaxID=90242 RepID=UPI0011B236DC|nr:hypothetical protein [Neisseria iguanae]
MAAQAFPALLCHFPAFFGLPLGFIPVPEDSNDLDDSASLGSRPEKTVGLPANIGFPHPACPRLFILGIKDEII